MDLTPPDLGAEDSSATIIQGPPSDGATVIMDRSALPGAAPGAKLVFLTGPKAGAEVKLTAQETTLGRQSDNAVVIPDISVSRHHVAVRRQGAQYALADLGSGNGSILNGERIDGEVPLQDGDVFSMGDTEVRFEMPRPPPRAPAALARRGDAPVNPPARRKDRAVEDDIARPEDTTTTGLSAFRGRRLNKRQLLIAGGAAAVMILLIVALKLRQTSAPQGPTPEEEKIQAMGSRMAQLAEEGKKALNAGDYKAASAALNEAQELAVQVSLDDGDVKTLRRQAEYAKSLVGGQEALEKAQSWATQLEFAKAMELLKPYAGEDHALHDTAFKVIAQMKARAAEKLAGAKVALAAKNLDQARAVLDDLKALDPELPEAKELDGLIREAAEKSQQPKQAKPVTAPKDPLAPVAAAVAAGKLEEALSAAAAVNAKAVKESLVAFKDGCTRELDADGAVRHCQELLRRIPGGEASPFMEPLKRKVAATSVAEGIKHVGAESWARAYQAFHQALQADPGNAIALKNMHTIKVKAKEFFNQAYVDRSVDADKARQEFEQVISMTAPDDELSVKSKSHLRKMGGE